MHETQDWIPLGRRYDLVPSRNTCELMLQLIYFSGSFVFQPAPLRVYSDVHLDPENTIPNPINSDFDDMAEK